ncbi:T6SS phospholipase effector Tle1-like catalytic domain-containing protein [Pseudomonas akapageensis]|uniref:T6SS phospholipase effector Tle1-like catalytic domain-containing protein n=1 Tax=Pseudomonas akapageensis TaxID=2609961 RepID=UPI00140BCC79|nr:DUF2235 domain-containing protein [Pseudomonas akapageensis]
MSTHLVVHKGDTTNKQNPGPQQQIILRLGVFFDGTGNNRLNSESMAGCFATSVNLRDQDEDIRAHCAAHGYDGEGSSPDNSYGNDVSNVARLYELYEDHAYLRLAPDAGQASLKVYLEGIGTSSGKEDSLYSQSTGLGNTGVLARVEQSPAACTEQIRVLRDNNPNVRIRRIEFDIFGFSRGAAAARHFANDLLKGAQSLLAKALPAGSPALTDNFAWCPQQDIALNFIGLFDTVAGIVAPLRGDLSPANASNHGLDLRLAPEVARKVVQLVARDEYRHNFSLIRTDADIVLPGAHSDIGGGYLPQVREELLLSKPESSLVHIAEPPERTKVYLRTRRQFDQRLAKLQAKGVQLELVTWSVNQPYNRRHDLFAEKRVYTAIRGEREVFGHLSLVYLRIMRELGIKHQVPFMAVPETPAFALPAELQPIAGKLQAYVLGKNASLGLSEIEESLLQRRYIHLSAHWNAGKGWNNSALDSMFINRPADSGQRTLHPNQ